MAMAEAKYNPDGPYWEVVIQEPGAPTVTFITDADSAYPGEVAERLASAYNRTADQLGIGP